MPKYDLYYKGQGGLEFLSQHDTYALAQRRASTIPPYYVIVEVDDEDGRIAPAPSPATDHDTRCTEG